MWADTLVLALLTGRPLPRVPTPVRRGWPALGARGGECLLATVLDRAVTARSAGIRDCYPPQRLLEVAAALARRVLAHSVGLGPAAPVRAGHIWVLPQLRWLHEMERVRPLGRGRGRRIQPGDLAPPLDFALDGLPDWPGIRVADRIDGLLRHPLGPGSERNRTRATVALLGDDDHAGFEADLAITGIGLGPRDRLRHAGRVMGIIARDGRPELPGGALSWPESGSVWPGGEPGWLEVVLSWPRRMTRAAWDMAELQTTTG